MQLVKWVGNPVRSYDEAFKRWGRWNGKLVFLWSCNPLIFGNLSKFECALVIIPIYRNEHEKCSGKGYWISEDVEESNTIIRCTVGRDSYSISVSCVCHVAFIRSVFIPQSYLHPSQNKRQPRTSNMRYLRVLRCSSKWTVAYLGLYRGKWIQTGCPSYIERLRDDLLTCRPLQSNKTLLCVLFMS